MRLYVFNYCFSTNDCYFMAVVASSKEEAIEEVKKRFPGIDEKGLTDYTDEVEDGRFWKISY